MLQSAPMHITKNLQDAAICARHYLTPIAQSFWRGRAVVLICAAVLIPLVLIFRKFREKSLSPPPPPVNVPPITVGLILAIHGYFPILDELKKVNDWQKRVELLNFLAEVGGRCKSRSEEQKVVAKIFFEQIALLPKEHLFPVGKGEQVGVIELLFSKLDKEMGVLNWSSPLTEELGKFLKSLSPTEEDRLVTLLPLALLSYNRPSGIREFSRRYGLGQIDKAMIHKYLDHYLKAGGGQYFLGNGAWIFIPEVSPQLLERLLNEYATDFYINFMTVRAFGQIPSVSDAYQKLLIFVNWYSKESQNWRPAQKASRLFHILDMANQLMGRMKISNAVEILQKRDRGRVKPSEHIFLTSAMIQSWIPEEYASWAAFHPLAEDIPSNDEVKKFFPS